MTKPPAMPELPEPAHRGPTGTGAYFDSYTADQMRARDAMWAERLAALQQQPPAIADAIHYPGCWDTAAYPTLESALHEMTAWFKCSNDECQQRAAVSDAEIDAHLDLILRAAGSALKHYTTPKSKADLRAALRSAILALRAQAVPMTDTQLCEALGIDGADDWTYEVRDKVQAHFGIGITQRADGGEG